MEQLAEEENRKLLGLFRGERSGFLRAGTQGYLLPVSFSNFPYDKLELRASDLWITTFPRSGTTWCQELLWLVNNGLDYKTAEQKNLLERFPFMDLDFLVHEKLSKEIQEMNKDNATALALMKSTRINQLLKMEKMESPRHIKTHLPLELLPPNLLDTCKVVYVARNPLDVAVSYYHHNRLATLHDYTGDFPTYWQLFKNNQVVYAPYWAHVESAYQKRDNPNLLFLFYEDLKTDLAGQVRKVAAFLNKPIQDDQVAELCNYLHIDNFRKRSSLKIDVKGIFNENREPFIRRGEIGGNKNKEFTGELEKDAMDWFKENLKRSQIKFPTF